LEIPCRHFDDALSSAEFFEVFLFWLQSFSSSIHTSFQASAAVSLSYPFFWDIASRHSVIGVRRFKDSVMVSHAEVKYSVNKLLLVFILLGDSPASELYVPTLRNTVSTMFISSVLLTPPMKTELAECSEISPHKIQKAGIIQKKKYNIQNTEEI
jgi:hypothetical protein